MSKLRFGILSTAKIGTQIVIPALQRGQFTEVVAIASRELARAQAAADELDILRAYGSYEELLADPQVDAVYNPLPNHLHVPWSLKALDAGKHVLCEKPIALSSREAGELEAASRARPELKVMEAFMYRFHPQWHKAREIIAAGEIGTLRAIQTFFSFFNDDPANIRNRPEVGGGALLDIGCYCVSTARLIFAAEPQRVCGIVEYDPKFRTDRLATGILDFGVGTAAFTCSTQLSPYQRVHIHGTEGRIEIEIPFNAPLNEPCKMWHQHHGQIEEIILPVSNQYQLQCDAYARAVLDDTPVPTPLEDAVANMRVVESLVASGKRREWVRVEA